MTINGEIRRKNFITDLAEPNFCDLGQLKFIAEINFHRFGKNHKNKEKT